MKPYSKLYTQKSTKNNKNSLLILYSFLGLLFIFVCSLSFGASKVSANDVWKWMFGLTNDENIRNIMLHVRLPRSIAPILCGVALSVSGLLLQSALNNSLVSPGTIGVNAGAGFFAVLSSLIFPGVLLSRPLFAFIGAIITTIIIFVIAKKMNISKNAIIMIGVALSSLLAAFTDAVVTIFPESLMDKNSFFVGGFSHITLLPIFYVIPMIIIGILCSVLLTSKLNLLSLGDEIATSLGLSVNVCRYIAMVSAALLSASAICIGGLLGFVGLIVPHIARYIIGNDHKVLLPITAIWGGILVIFCDMLGRLIFKPYELPVGILLSILGAPFFLFLVLNKPRRVFYD